MEIKFFRLTLLFGAIGLFMLSSCGKGGGRCGCAPPPQSYKHFFSSMTKGTALAWNEDNFNDTIRNDSVILSVKKLNYNYTVNLKFSLNDKGTKNEQGMFIKTPEATFYQYGLTPGGVLLYKLDATAKNTLYTEIKEGLTDATKGQWIVGYFNMTFKLATPTGNTAFDTTRVYFPGSFGVKLAK